MVRLGRGQWGLGWGPEGKCMCEFCGWLGCLARPVFSAAEKKKHNERRDESSAARSSSPKGGEQSLSRCAASACSHLTAEPPPHAQYSVIFPFANFIFFFLVTSFQLFPLCGWNIDPSPADIFSPLKFPLPSEKQGEEGGPPR